MPTAAVPTAAMTMEAMPVEAMPTEVVTYGTTSLNVPQAHASHGNDTHTSASQAHANVSGWPLW